MASTLDRTLNPGAALVIQTAGTASQTTQEGWAQVLANGAVSGFAVFALTVSNGSQEAVVPLETRNPGSFVLWFDNTGGYSTGVALANVATVSGSIGVVIRDASGEVLSSGSMTLAGLAHTSFMLAGQFAATANQSGTAEFQTPAGGQIAVLGIRANPNNAITTVPPLAE
jgi:hypothetical protein